MLSRVVDSLYWMSRYLERAEHTAQLVDVNLNLMLDQSPEHTAHQWQGLLQSLRLPEGSTETVDVYEITRMLTFEPTNGASIVACIVAARENAQQIRGEISAEMWEHLNRLSLQVRSANIDKIWNGEPHQFFQSVKEAVHLFQGVTDATMNHGQGWHFIQLGRFIERAGATAKLLDTHFSALRGPQDQVIEEGYYLEWVGLLRSCAAFEAYCKVYTAALQPDRVAEFLLLNPEFPRSVRFAAGMIQSSLQAIAGSTETRKAGRAERLAGRLLATLSYSQIDELLTADLHLYLEDIQRQCAHIHSATYQTYISYSIESALAS